MDKIQAIVSKLEVLICGGREALLEDCLRHLSPCADPNKIYFYNTPEALKAAELPESPNRFALLLSEDPSEVIGFLHHLQEKGVNSRQTLACVKENSPLDYHYRSFGLSCLSRPQEVPLQILAQWESFTAEKLHEEIAKVTESGALSLLSRGAGLAPITAIERARLCYALASHLSEDLNFLSRTVRLALYYDLDRMEDWESVVKESRELWGLKKLLEYKRNLRLQGGITEWPAELPLEIALIESAQMACSLQDKGESEYRRVLRQFSAGLPFKARTSLRIAADRCFKHLWRKQNAAA